MGPANVLFSARPDAGHLKVPASQADSLKEPGDSRMTYPNVQLYIDGKWRPAASGKTIPVVNPATEEVIGTVAHAAKGDLDEALAAAEKGFKAWRTVSSLERSKVMRKAAELIRERAEKIATI